MLVSPYSTLKEVHDHPVTRKIVEKYVPDCENYLEAWGASTMKEFCEKADLGKRGEEMMAELAEVKED